MNKFCFVITFLFCLSSLAQDIFIPDQVFRVRLILEGVDTNNDDIIQQSEALAVTSLIITGDNGNADISDLEGIQFFTNLEVLDIGFNALVDVDLSALVQLQSLKANSNDLTTLNLNGLSNLTELYLYSNQLSTIDLSSQNNLQRLSIRNNDLDSINISNLTNLESLVIHSNNLSVLDVSSLTSLEYLNCGLNEISILDVSQLTNLTILECGGNQIEILDLTNSTALEYIDAGMNNLLALDCSNTRVTFASVRLNNNLTYYNVNNGFEMDLADPDLLYLPIGLGQTPSLTTVCIDNMPNEVEALRVSGYNSSNVSVFTGVNCIEELGVETNRIAEINLFPNPVTTHFNITNWELISNFSIFDLTGKILFETNSYQEIQNSVISLKQGVYFLQVQADSKNTNTIKLIKK